MFRNAIFGVSLSSLFPALLKIAVAYYTWHNRWAFNICFGFLRTKPTRVSRQFLIGNISIVVKPRTIKLTFLTN